MRWWYWLSINLKALPAESYFSKRNDDYNIENVFAKVSDLYWMSNIVPNIYQEAKTALFTWPKKVINEY